MKSVFLVSMLMFLGIAVGDAGEIKCPPAEWLTERDKWEKEYSGWLTEVVVMRMFKDQKESGIVRCTRETGTLQIWVSKSCRIIAGGGTVEEIDHSKGSEISSCKMPSTRNDNDKSCIVECN